MITVLAKLKAQPGKEASLAEVCIALAKEVRENEKGCLMYVPHVSVDNPAEIFIFEKYADQEALKNHREMPHYKAAREKFREILDGQSVVHILNELGS